MAPRKGWRFGPRPSDRVPVRPGLEKAITAAGLTYDDLAAKLGVHRITVSRWVRGLSWPSDSALDGLVRELAVSEDELDDLIDTIDPTAQRLRRAS